jgi:hypothetical protein
MSDPAIGVDRRERQVAPPGAAFPTRQAQGCRGFATVAQGRGEFGIACLADLRPQQAQHGSIARATDSTAR